MALTNVDGLITSVETGTEAPPREVTKEAAPEPQAREPETRVEYETTPETPSETPTNDSDVDDYGNPAQPAKMYTEEEVNERINTAMRRRWKEEQEKKQHQQQPPMPQNAAQDFKYDETNTDSWEQQLETFVERTLDKVSQKQAQQQIQQREQAAQIEFETKFTAGMSRFPDFVDVVGTKPISDAMTVATRSMKDPAAFLYAASKTQAAELERISRIPDPYTQIAEMGRLEERMRKVRSATNAPKPVPKSAGDMSDKPMGRGSVDDKIHAHAKSKFR